jgi:hypothetical protein
MDVGEEHKPIRAPRHWTIRQVLEQPPWQLETDTGIALAHGAAPGYQRAGSFFRRVMRLTPSSI